MKNCLLLTSEFPYYNGEPFLLNEMPYLCNAFDNIYIFSINGLKTDKPTREIPNNANVYPLGSRTSKFKYIYYAAKGLLDSNSKLRITEKNGKRIFASLYARGRANDIAKSIREIVTQEKIDIKNSIIYSFWFSYQAIAAMILKDGFNSEGYETKAFSRAHGYDLYWDRTAINFQPYQDVLIRNLDAVLPCSDFGRKYLLERFAWAESKITVSRLGTANYGLNTFNKEKIIVTCSNIEPIKRLGLFAKAFCIAAQKDTDIKWICIGSGIQLDEIKQIISDANMIDRVEFTGRLANDKVLDLYKTRGIMYFCNVSSTEGLPVSIMEALSFGIPVIATDVGGTSELVNSDDGQLIHANVEKCELANILLEAVALNETCYFNKRESSRKTWGNLASAEANYNSLIKLFESEVEVL